MNCEACGHANVDGARFCASCGGLLPIEDQENENALVGQIIGGRYRVTGVLGEGGMGIVYVGEQQMGSTVRKVAIKTLHQHLSKDPSVLARFHRECGTVAQLEHPNTIKFFDFGSTADGTLYIAMEFVKGEPLNDVIEKRGPITPERTLKILKQVCGALEEAHEQGIIHRDLKPENIILTERAGVSDFAKVLDFGIAARSESADAQKEAKLTQQGMVLGTPPYMSPEQFTGKALDRRSDIYSLGVMAYEMLTGKLPFEADTPWQWATQHMTAQPLPFEVTAPATSIPDPIRRAILRALSKDREERHPTAREFYADISSGGGLTADEPAQSLRGGAAAAASSGPGTAAMAAAPDFSAMSAGAVAPPAAMAQHHQPMMAAPPPMVMAPPPAASSGGGGGKGIIIGLVGLMTLLGIVIVVVLVIRAKPSTIDDQPLTNPFTSASGQTTIAPELDPSAVAAAGDDAGAEQGSDPPPKPTVTAKPTSTGTTTATTAKTAQPGGNAAACDQCIAAAQGGNISGAASHYRNCSDTGKKNLCSRAARTSAPGAAASAARNGNCAQAKAIMAAANGMGAGSGALNNALSGTTCK